MALLYVVLRVPPLTYWAHPFKPLDRMGSLQYGRAYESQDERTSRKSWLEGARKHFTRYWYSFIYHEMKILGMTDRVVIMKGRQSVQC